MATEKLGFTTRDAREEQYLAWKSEGSTGMGRHTTHVENNRQIIYVVTRYVPAEPSTEVPLHDAGASDMIGEGGNIDGENQRQQIEPVAANETVAEVSGCGA